MDNFAHDVGAMGHAAVSRPETIGREIAVRLVLKPALSRSWRDSDTLQFGTITRYAGVLGQADKTLCDFLGLVDGTRDRPELLEAGEQLGLGREPADALLTDLEETGLLDDAEAAGTAMARFPQPHRDLLGPDLASLSLVHSGPGAAPAVLARRAGARIEVAARAGWAPPWRPCSRPAGRARSPWWTAAGCAPGTAPRQDCRRGTSGGCG